MGALFAAPRRSDELRPVSRYPSSDIDLAFSVPDEVPAGAVERTLRDAGGELLEDLRLFDVYRGEGIADRQRSLAFRLRFCAQDRTLTDAEVGEIRTRAIEAVESAHNASLRG
jgi:phenylalanyl-tRNA synthetase beta chain